MFLLFNLFMSTEEDATASNNEDRILNKKNAKEL